MLCVPAWCRPRGALWANKKSKKKKEKKHILDQHERARSEVGGGSRSGNGASHGESLKVFRSALEKTENWWLFPRLPPVMCSARASKLRQFRESQREAQWIAVELAAAKAALKCRGIWAKWAAKGGNTWMWELAGWCCCLHIRVVICVWQRECYSQLC